MAYVLKRIKFGKTVFFLIVIGMFVINHMLYHSAVNFTELYDNTPEGSTIYKCLLEDDDFSDKSAKQTAEELVQIYRNRNDVKNVWISTEDVNDFWFDKERVGVSGINMLSCIYNERYYDYVDGEAPESLAEDEVILPRSYTPGDINLYGNGEYMDASSLIGKTITYVSDREKTNTDTNAEVEMKVVGTYDNIRAGNDGRHILLNEKSRLSSSLPGYNVYIQYKKGVKIEKRGWDVYPEGYEWLEFSGGGGDDSIDIAHDVENVRRRLASYKENYLPYGLIIPFGIIALYTGWGIKKGKVLKQLAECFFCIITAYISGIGISLYVAYRHNMNLETINNFMRYHRYVLEDVPLLVAAGVALIAVFVVFHILDLKKNRELYDEE